jgi:hypothetical protein
MTLSSFLEIQRAPFVHCFLFVPCARLQGDDAERSVTSTGSEARDREDAGTGADFSFTRLFSELNSWINIIFRST